MYVCERESKIVCVCRSVCERKLCVFLFLYVYMYISHKKAFIIPIKGTH